jgi:hypothetical protein
MLKQTFAFKRDFDGKILIITNNPNLKSCVRTLSKIANFEETDTYVSFKGFKKNVAIFEYWGADTFEKAIKRESLESKIENAFWDYCDYETHSTKEEFEDYLYTLFDERFHDILEESLPKLYRKYKKIEENKQPKVELYIDYSLLMDEESEEENQIMEVK